MSQQFTKESVKKYSEILCVKIEDYIKNIFILDAQLNTESLKNEYKDVLKAYQSIEAIKDVDKFMKDPWSNLSAIFYQSISQKLGYLISYPEFCKFRLLLEDAINDKNNNEHSTYTEIIKFLNIPQDLIPKEFIYLMYDADEFKRADTYIFNELDKFDDHVNFDSIIEFRKYVRSKAEYIIDNLHKQTFFGTHNIDLFSEMLVAAYFNFPALPPLYNSIKTNKRESIFNNITILQKLNNSLWEQLHNGNSNDYIDLDYE